MEVSSEWDKGVRCDVCDYPRRGITSVQAAAAETLDGGKRMTLHPIEEATLRAFVIPAKRDRLLALFSSTKRRKQARNMLNHFHHWNVQFTQIVKSSEDVLILLRKAGAPAECHVISDSFELDGRDIPLADAVIACECYPFASVLCCVPGELAFYFDEVAKPRNRLLLRCRTGTTLADESRSST